jgi:hypothetical protein
MLGAGLLDRADYFERLRTRVGTSYKATIFSNKNRRIAAYTPVFYVPTRVRRRV